MDDPHTCVATEVVLQVLVIKLLRDSIQQSVERESVRVRDVLMRDGGITVVVGT